MNYSQDVCMMARKIVEREADKEALIFEMWKEDGFELGMIDLNQDMKECFMVDNAEFGTRVINKIKDHYEETAEMLIEAATEQLTYEREQDETQRWMGEERI